MNRCWLPLLQETYRELRPRAPFPEFELQFYPFVNINNTIRLAEGRIAMHLHLPAGVAARLEAEPQQRHGQQPDRHLFAGRGDDVELAYIGLRLELAREREQVIRLSPRDWNWLLDLMENPPKPNAKLKAAMKRYQKAKRDCAGFPPAGRAPARRSTPTRSGKAAGFRTPHTLSGFPRSIRPRRTFDRKAAPLQSGAVQPLLAEPLLAECGEAV